MNHEINNDQVDDLLKDLDTALSIEPSPSVAVRVRTRIASEPARSAFGMRWVLVAGASALVIMAGYLTWPAPPVKRTSEPQVASVPFVSQSPAPVPTPAAASVATVRPVAAAAHKSAQRKIEEEPAGPDLRVLISPRQQLGMVQLRAALRDGRVTDEALTPPPFPAPEAPIVIAPVEIETFKVGQLSAPRAGGGDLFAKRSGK